ncbi:2,3-bisphosphoglycerate-dependent phosphoglycerate mutase [Streptomyces californicus]
MTSPRLVPPSSLSAVRAIRHGRSTANLAFAEAERTGATGLPVSGVDRDVPLSRSGIDQARALGRWWSHLPPGHQPDLVVCSPYERAMRTWQEMARTAADVVDVETVVDERLRDREMGVYELYTPAALRARSPEEADRRERVGEWHYRPPGGEAMTDVAVRVGQFLTDLDRAAQGRSVLIVAHDAIVIAFRHVLGGIGAVAPGRLPTRPQRLRVHLGEPRGPPRPHLLGRHPTPHPADHPDEGDASPMNDRTDPILHQVTPVPGGLYADSSYETVLSEVRNTLGSVSAALPDADGERKAALEDFRRRLARTQTEIRPGDDDGLQAARDLCMTVRRYMGVAG